MNKQELIDQIAKSTGLSKSTCEAVINEALDVIKKTVKKGEDVKLVGFGTFTRTRRKARVGRNPQTGKEIKIPATFAPKFRPGSEFKNLVK